MSLITGIGASTWINPPKTISFILIVVSLALAVLALVSSNSSRGVFFVIIAGMVIGLATGSLELGRVRDVVIPFGDLDSGAKLVCDARVKGDAVGNKTGAWFDAGLIRCRLPERGNFEQARGTARIYSYGDSPEVSSLMSGDFVRFKARIKRPVDFRNGGGFSWKDYLASRGVGAVGSLSGPEWIVAETDPGGRGVSGILDKLRKRLDGAIASSCGADEAGILRAMVSGSKEAVSDDVRRVFQRTGLAHLLAISGLHVGYVALFIYFVVKLLAGLRPSLLLRIPLKRLSAFVTLPCVWGFIFMVGAPVSAVRAGIMISVYLIGIVVDVRQDILTTLAIAALIIVALQPLAVFDVSFQLSFVSVLSIVIIAPKLFDLVGNWRRDRRGFVSEIAFRLYQMFAVTLAATIGSSPLVAYHFNIFSTIGLIANLLAIPWTGFVIIPVAAVASILTVVWSKAAVSVFWPLAGKASEALLVFASFLADKGKSQVFAAAPSPLELVLIYAFVAVVVFWRHVRHRKIIALAVMLVLAADVGWWHLRPFFTKDLEVVFFDVGQGESILVRFPGGENMLVDGGGLSRGEFDIGDRVVAPALLRRGVHRLDRIVLTHPHHDHYRGLGAMFERFRPAMFWTNGRAAPVAEFAFWNDLQRRIADADVETEVADSSLAPLEVDGVKIGVLHPPKGLRDVDDLNDTSVVLKLTYGDVSILLTGDLSKPGEEMLMNSGSDLRAAVLKLGHHGSGTSSYEKFLDEVDPRYAVISVGKYNSYGMPDKELMEELHRRKIEIFRTDQDGAITIKTDGHDIEIEKTVE